MRPTTWRRPAVLAVAALLAAVAGLTSSTAASAAGNGVISGTLTNHTGAPVANASVHIRGYSHSAEATTSATGFYTVSVPVGSYRLEFDAPGDAFPTQWAHGKLSYQDAESFQVASGATTTVNETLLQPGTVSGALVTSTGQPRQGVSVSILGPGGSGASAYTGAGGSFSIQVLPGQYRVLFRAIEGDQYAPGKRTYEEAAVFTVLPGQTLTVNESLLATGSITGRVLRTGGAPMASARVAAVQANGQYVDTMTNADGYYTIPSVFSGTYRIRVTLPSNQELWAPQALRQQDGTQHDVVAGAATTVNVTLLPTGSVSGKFIGTNGLSVPNTWVTMISTNGYTYLNKQADSGGNFAFAEVFAGSYRVQFSASLGVQQWAYGKLKQSEAATIVVTGGANTVVNDQALPTGSVRITATDALTGQPIPEFYGYVGNYGDWTGNGVLILPAVAAGTHHYQVDANGYQYTAQGEIVVLVGQQATLNVILTPTAKLAVTIVDAQTLAPLEGACVFAHEVPYFRTGDGCGNFTDGDGKLTLEYMRTGDYQVFAFPPEGGVHGAQWVGANGLGTGDQRQAKVFHLTDGQTLSGLVIKLDRAGVVTGTVTSETGQPLQYQSAGIVTGHGGIGGTTGEYIQVDSQGHYSVDWLGPYQWPLIFRAQGHANQWGGGVSNRYDATRVSVTSGATSTFNQVLKVGVTVSSSIKMPDGTPGQGFLSAMNSVTGDYEDQMWAYEDGNVAMQVINPASIKFSYDAYIEDVYWNGSLWVGGNSLGSARTFAVGPDGASFAFCLTTLSRMIVCDSETPRRGQPETPTPQVPRRPVPGEPTDIIIPRR